VRGDAHGHLRAFEEGRDAVGLAVALRVFEEADAVVFRPLVIGGPEVRVAFDDQQPAPAVEGDADGVNDVRRGGEALDDEARVSGLWSVVRGAGRQSGAENECGQGSGVVATGETVHRLQGLDLSLPVQLQAVAAIRGKRARTYSIGISGLPCGKIPEVSQPGHR